MHTFFIMSRCFSITLNLSSSAGDDFRIIALPVFRLHFSQGLILLLTVLEREGVTEDLL